MLLELRTEVVGDLLAQSGWTSRWGEPDIPAKWDRETPHEKSLLEAQKGALGTPVDIPGLASGHVETVKVL